MDDATARWKAKSAAYQKSATLENRKNYIRNVIVTLGICGMSILSMCMVIYINIGHCLEECNAFLPEYLHFDEEHINRTSVAILMTIVLLVFVNFLGDLYYWEPDKDYTDPLVAIDTCEQIREATLLSIRGTCILSLWEFQQISVWIDNGIISSEHQETIVDLKKRCEDNQRHINAFKYKYPHALKNSAKVMPFFEEVRQNLANLEDEWTQLHSIIVNDLPDPEVLPEDIMKSKQL